MIVLVYHILLLLTLLFVLTTLLLTFLVISNAHIVATLHHYLYHRELDLEKLEAELTEQETKGMCYYVSALILFCFYLVWCFPGLSLLSYTDGGAFCSQSLFSFH